MKKNTGYTPEERLAITAARDLLKRSVHDDTSIDVFNLAMINYDNVTASVVAARSARNTKKPLIKRIFNK